ncbi:unnamed protein product [Arabidopsis lyrata]|nr:unnamed protein product [Arabidopsis lyrata]
MITISALNASLLSLSLLIASFCCSRRICYCSLGFSRGANAKEEFLKEVNRVEEFLKDPCVSSKVFNGDTVQEASAQKKRVALQRQAAVTVEAAEDYARRESSLLKKEQELLVAEETVASKESELIQNVLANQERKGYNREVL